MKSQKAIEVRQRLSEDYKELVSSIQRGRVAAEEIKSETRKDEGDRAVGNHDRDLVDNLNELAFRRLRVVREAIQSLNQSQYGKCLGCGKTISSKRLEAVPWATTCILCQESTESGKASSHVALAEFDAEGED